MIWSFVRQSARVNVEIRRSVESGKFELVVDYPDGSEVIEEFRRARRLLDRALDVQGRLIRDGWQPSGRCLSGPAPTATEPRSAIRRAASRVAEAQSRWARRLAACFGF